MQNNKKYFITGLLFIIAGAFSAFYIFSNGMIAKADTTTDDSERFNTSIYK